MTGGRNHVLRVAVPVFMLLQSMAAAMAGPLLNDDAATCSDQKTEIALRVGSCERLLAAGNLAGKDLANALYVRGSNALNNKRDYSAAVAALTAAIAADPDNAALYNSRGVAYDRKGQDDLALADYTIAIQKGRNFGLAYNNRGAVYLRRNALQNALDDLNAAIRYTPKLYLGRINRGRILAVIRDFDSALADFAEAEKIDSNPPQAWMYRCDALTVMGRFDDAIASCNGILGRAPKNQYALTSRAEANLGKGDLDAALADIDAVLAVNPNYVRAHAVRGQIFEQKRDPAQARSEYRAAASALTAYDELDVANARKLAQQRLAALTPPPPRASTPAPAPAQTPRKIALIIGNGAYKNVHALPNPPRDAKLIADTLRGVGFETVTLSNDLTRNKFFEALHKFGTQAETADWAVIYYAGHGFEIGGVNYLVPVDARLAADRDAETEAVALEQVLAAVSAARKLRLVILDACRDNPFAPSMKQTLALRLVDKGFSNIEPGAGMMVVYAAKHGETALDGEGGDSPFATALARDIKEPRIEIRRLFDIVRDDVWASTNHLQQPFTYGSPPGRSEFFFVADK